MAALAVPPAFEFPTACCSSSPAAHCCRTFLGDSERERRLELEAPAACKSVWTYVLAHRRAYESRVYHHHAAALWPVASVKRVRLWEQYYCRWDSEFHPHGPSAAAWIPDFGNLAVTATARAKNKYANAVAAATTSFMAGEVADDDDEDDDAGRRGPVTSAAAAGSRELGLPDKKARPIRCAQARARARRERAGARACDVYTYIGSYSVFFSFSTAPSLRATLPG